MPMARDCVTGRENEDIAFGIFNKKTFFKYFVYQSVINLFKVDESE